MNIDDAMEFLREGGHPIQPYDPWTMVMGKLLYCGSDNLFFNSKMMKKTLDS